MLKKINDEEYRIEPDPNNKMTVPIRIFANQNIIQNMLKDKTISQAINVASLPGVVGHVSILPDGHEAYGFPVGCVAAMDAKDGMICPGGVGYDINCGVRMMKTQLFEKDVRTSLKKLINCIFDLMPTGIGSNNNNNNKFARLNQSHIDEILVNGLRWAIKNGYGVNSDIAACEDGGRIKNIDISKVSNQAKKRGMVQLGSIGSGNHFIEVQKVVEIHDVLAAEKMGIKLDQITVLIHCGSRGLGHQVCSDYLRVYDSINDKSSVTFNDKQLSCMKISSEEGQAYKDAMHGACNFAWCNRQIISYNVRQSFQKVFKKSESDLGMDTIYDMSHNIAKTETHYIDGQKKSLLVHRKGAARAFTANPDDDFLPEIYNSLSGQPVFIPGSMGTASWILLGRKNSMDLSFGSTAHGAGRIIPRHEAKNRFSEVEIYRKLNENKILVKTHSKNGIVEEASQAYKDVDAVVNVSHNLGIATKVAKLVPLCVIK